MPGPGSAIQPEESSIKGLFGPEVLRGPESGEEHGGRSRARRAPDRGPPPPEQDGMSEGGPHGRSQVGGAHRSLNIYASAT